MRANSLALRLFLSATAWTVVILVVTGIVLSSLYRSGRARLRPPPRASISRTLVADVATPEEAARRQFAVARRAAVRTAAVRLVLAGRPGSTRRGRTCARRARCGTTKLPHLEDIGVAAEPPPARAAAMSTGPRTSACGWSSAPSISATRARYLVSGRRRRDRDRRGDPRLRLVRSASPSAALAIVLLLTTIFQVRFGLAPLKRISEIARRDPLRPRRAAGRRVSRSRSRRWRARPMR